jgi:1-deoxy-D-xylulose-5-phosphate reductoisomerase
MTYESVDTTAFPTLQLGIDAGQRGGAAPAVFNAANEQAVALFLDGKLSFTKIPTAIASALDALSSLPSHTLDDILEVDRRARHHVSSLSIC